MSQRKIERDNSVRDIHSLNGARSAHRSETVIYSFNIAPNWEATKQTFTRS